MWTVFLTANVLFSAYECWGDETPRLWDLSYSQAASISVSTGPSGLVSPSISYSPQFGIFFDRLHFGLGARFLSAIGVRPVGFAPVDNSGLPATMILYDPLIFAINAMFTVNYEFLRVNNHHFELGGNADLIGVGFGKSSRSRYIASDITLNGLQPTNTPLLNVRNFVNDRGQLNAELYVKYTYKETWGFRIGYGRLTLETKSDIPLVGGVERFRTQTNLIILAADYRI
jgi:hypothetical protein